MEVKHPTTDTDALLEFLFRLGQAYLASGEQTAVVKLYLSRIASANSMRRSRVVAFSTALGTLVGESVYDWLSKRLSWWQLQIGRIGRYLRREGKR
jgi:hypothetical protein